ncbi:MAG: hypothetical protein ACJ76P_03165 [Actinomycetota bacterium]
MALQNGDATPTSARWLRTDAKTAAPAVGLSPDQATGGVEFLVVLEGNFVGQLAKVPSGSQAPTGTRLAITLDPKTHQVLDYGVTNRSVELPGLLPFRLAPVPAPSSPRVCSLLTAAEVARALDTTVRNVSQLTKEDFMVPQRAGSAAGRYTTSRSTSLTLALSPISWEAYRRTYLSPGPSDVVEKVRGIGRGARFEGCNELSVFSGGHVLSLGLQRGACDAADELKSLARIALVRILDLNVPTSFTSSPQPP